MFRLPNEENVTGFYTVMGHLAGVMFICKLRTLPGRKLLCELEILLEYSIFRYFSGTQVNLDQTLVSLLLVKMRSNTTEMNGIPSMEVRITWFFVLIKTIENGLFVCLLYVFIYYKQ